MLCLVLYYRYLCTFLSVNFVEVVERLPITFMHQFIWMSMAVAKTEWPFFKQNFNKKLDNLIKVACCHICNIKIVTFCTFVSHYCKKRWWHHDILSNTLLLLEINDLSHIRSSGCWLWGLTISMLMPE